MYCVPVSLLQFDIATLDGCGSIEARTGVEEIGFIPVPGDILTQYRWFHRPMRIVVVSRYFDTDYGILRLKCNEVNPEVERTKTVITEEDGQYVPKARKMPGEDNGESALAPYLSTDGTGREKMTPDNYKQSTQPRSFVKET